MAHRDASRLTDRAAADGVDDVLLLSDAGVTQLLQILAAPPSLEMAVRLAELFRSALAAVAQGDIPKAVEHLAAFAVLDPRRAESLPTDPAFASIHVEVARLLNSLTFAARADAEARMDQARQVTGSEAAVRIAEQLAAAGGFANFVHARELSQMVLNRGAPKMGEESKPSLRWLLWIALALVGLLLLMIRLWR